MSRSTFFALVVLGIVATAVTFTLCSGSERCLDGHGEFTGRDCP